MGNRFSAVNKRSAVGVLLALVFLAGCQRGYVKDLFSKETDSELLSRLAMLEQTISHGLFDVAFSSQTPQLVLTRGKLLVNDQGAFRYEQGNPDANRDLWVQYHPQAGMTVCFNKKATAYHFSNQIFTGENANSILALYDSVRLILGMSQVWSNPEQNQVEVSASKSASFQQSGRNFSWKIQFADTTGIDATIDTMTARQGLSKFLLVTREQSSAQVYSRDNSKGFFDGQKTGAMESFYQWDFEFKPSKSKFNLVMTPYSISPDELTQLMPLLDKVEMESNIKVIEADLAVLNGWFNLR